jgi:hypothetical protein
VGRPGLEIDDQLEFGRLYDRKIGRFLAPENSTGIDADLMICVGKSLAKAVPAAGRNDHGDLDAGPDRRPIPAIDRCDLPPSGTRSPRSAIRYSRLVLSPLETLLMGVRWG